MTSQFRKEFGQHLRALREDRKLSQTALSSRTGLMPSAIAHFESGRRLPSVINLYRLALGLKVCPSDMLMKTLPASCELE